MLDSLVIGGVSPLGLALVRALEAQGDRVAFTSRRTNPGEGYFFDLETLEGFEDLPAASVVVIVAAETRFQTCETDPERSRRINFEAPRTIAQWAAKRGSKVVFFSTIAVHNCSIDQPDELIVPQPDSVYGQHKLEAEAAIFATDASSVVLRPSKVVIPDFPLLRSWIESLRQNGVITPFSDMIVSPVASSLVISCAVGLIKSKTAQGVYQLSAADQVTYAELAQALAKKAGYSEEFIQPVLASNVLKGEKTWLPTSARLGSRRICNELNIQLPWSLDVLNELNLD